MGDGVLLNQVCVCVFMSYGLAFLVPRGYI